MCSNHVILGGSGFIGRHVSCELARNGHLVKVVDAVSFQPDVNGVESVTKNLFDISVDQLIELISACDVVHHYVWSTIPLTAKIDPLADLYNNVGLTIKLLEAVRRVGGRRVVFSSSGGTIYGILHTTPAKEEHPLNPITAYGISKLTCENYLNYYHREYGIDIRIARISNPYGIGQRPDRQQGVVSTFVHHAKYGKQIDIFGDGSIVRDFIHIEDLTAALVKLSTVEFSGSADPRIYNVGGGERISIREVVAIIQRYVGPSLIIKHLPARSFDVPVNVLDITRAEHHLRWRPNITLSLGIERMLNDLRADIDKAPMFY